MDLNMRHYHIELPQGSKQLYTIVLPRGKHKYQKLPMGVCNSTNIPQEKISKIFEGFDMVHMYNYNVLVMTKIDFKDHINVL